MIFQTFSIPEYKKYLSILVLLFAGLIANAQEATLTAISNPKGAPSTMKMSDLKSIMKGEKQRWSDGTKVNIVLMKTNTSTGEITCRKIYSMSSDKVKRYWLGLSFSGKADAPIFCNSIAELESIVAQTPGAIGIIDKISTGTGIKIIMVDGKNSF
jgi:hypothetical protein